MMDTPVIDRTEVLAALQGGRAKLVMAMGEWAYRAAHIPGSLPCPTLAESRAVLSQDDDIVVYCTGPACPAGRALARQLKRQGFRQVRRYDGGLEDWAAAGYPLEGMGTA